MYVLTCKVNAKCRFDKTNHVFLPILSSLFTDIIVKYRKDYVILHEIYT